jgi:signal peptidase complex subunit 2
MFTVIYRYRFDDVYDLILAYYDGKSGKMRESSFHRSVADFFDENGLLCMDKVESAVLKMHKTLSSDKKDS